MKNTTDKYLCSVQEAAHMMGICRTNLYSLLSKNELQSVKIGARRLIKVESILALIDRQLEEVA